MIWIFVAAIGGAIVLIGEFSDGEKQLWRELEKWRLGPRQFRLAGAVIIIVSTLVSQIESEVSQARLEGLNRGIEAVTTGGDALAVVMADLKSFHDGRFRMQAYHGGDVHAAYNVRFEFTSVGDCNGLGFVLEDGTLHISTQFERAAYLSDIGPGSIVTLKPVLVPTCDYAYYTIHIQTRGAEYLQQLILRKVDGRWIQSARTFDANTWVLRQDTDHTTLAKSLPLPKTRWPSLDDAKALLEAKREIDVLGIISEEPE